MQHRLLSRVGFFKAPTIPASGRPACTLPDPAVTEKRGIKWIAASFLLCPCHLPLTLGLLSTLLGGSALGALLHGHPYLVGAVITLTWGVGTGYGVGHLRRASRYARAVEALRPAFPAGVSSLPPS
ncbi:hypothetical protein [Deinococcus sp.]|uniref:hypothetical protein n=1 Tax=Deinococcus sp. TaxID=47478 RepID=UPI003CC663A0